MWTFQSKPGPRTLLLMETLMFECRLDKIGWVLLNELWESISEPLPMVPDPEGTVSAERERIWTE